MPSTTSSSVSMAFASSTVMTPSLPTFCIASAIILPISASPFAEMVPICCDLGVGRDLLRAGLHVGDHRGHGEVDAALQVHRVHAGGHRLGALADDGMRQDRRGRRAVAGRVIGLRGDLADHLRAHVLELVRELDLLGDGDAVLGDARRAERLVDDDVAALRAERHLHRVRQRVDAAQHAVARIGRKLNFLGSHVLLLLNFTCSWPWRPISR